MILWRPELLSRCTTLVAAPAVGIGIGRSARANSCKASLFVQHLTAGRDTPSIGFIIPVEDLGYIKRCQPQSPLALHQVHDVIGNCHMAGPRISVA